MRYRAAVYSPFSECWVECFDDSSGEAYWFNSYSQETKWSKPLAVTIFEHAPNPTKKAVVAQQPNAAVHQTPV